ncbi:hypothetical protein ACP4OV_022411 [Aristida adscensionis]
MWCCEAKGGRSLTSWAQRHHGAGVVAGTLLLLLAYLLLSQHFAITGPGGDIVATEGRRKQLTRAPGETEEDDVVSGTGGPFSDTCEVDGDVRVNGTALSVAVVPTSLSEPWERRIRPYARMNVSGVREVTVAQLRDPAAAPPCAVTHGEPAVLFALGGYTGNFWHDFTDVLVPLFVASRRYGGEVVFLISGANPWWLGKYATLLRRLSRHDAVDLDGDARVRCFPRATVGLRVHREFTIVPELAPGGRRLSMADFTAFLREAYALPRAAPARKKPRLLLIHRGNYRRLVNEQEVARAAEAAGFEVAVMEPGAGGARMEEVARAVNSFDALVGMHGAGLTNAVFLPRGAVLVQVVPYGRLERMARREFGEPAADMGLRYLEYSASAAESTLLEMLGPEHPAIRDPLAVHRQGWDKVAEYYLGKQDVRIDVARFAPTLAQAMDHLRRRR